MAALLSFFTILSVLVLCSLGHAKPSKNSKLIVGSGDDTEEGSAVETPRPMTSKEEEELDEHYPWVLEREFGNGDCKFDFEHGVRGWQKTGTAFNNQPTYGDNPTARNRGQPAKQQGDWWIGGAEHRPTKETPPGQFQPGVDRPQGTLTSPYFEIVGSSVSFLIGGGCEMDLVRAELIVDGMAVRNETGNCHESMNRKFWCVHDFIGKSAQVRLVDHSSKGWGHINFDDFKGDITCGKQSPSITFGEF